MIISNHLVWMDRREWDLDRGGLMMLEDPMVLCTEIINRLNEMRVSL
jgi:hypothetical protein